MNFDSDYKKAFYKEAFVRAIAQQVGGSAAKHVQILDLSKTLGELLNKIEKSAIEDEKKIEPVIEYLKLVISGVQSFKDSNNI